MSIITDRQEPESSGWEEPKEPNEYAIRYLFNLSRPGQELRRSGELLFYSGAGSNLLALGLYAAWLELNFDLWLLGLAGLVVVCGGLAVIWRTRRPALALVMALFPFFLTVLVLLILFQAVPGPQAGFFIFFLPGSLALVIGSLFLRNPKATT